MCQLVWEELKLLSQYKKGKYLPIIDNQKITLRNMDKNCIPQDHVIMIGPVPSEKKKHAEYIDRTW